VKIAQCGRLSYMLCIKIASFPSSYLRLDLFAAMQYFRSGVTNVVPAGTSSPTRTMCVARGPVLKITLA